MGMSWIEDPGDWPGANLTELGLDEAYLNVTSTSSELLWLYTLSADCIRCPFRRFSKIIPGQSWVKINGKRALRFRFMPDGASDTSPVSDVSNRLCTDIDASLGEFGVYDLKVDEASGCTLNTVKDPVNIYLPLVAIILGLIIIAVLSTLITLATKKIVSILRDRRNEKTACEMSDYGADDRTTQVSAKPARQRVRSLDTFRGIAILLMIFVNDGAGGYWFLEHGTWDGLLAGDLVFPWFMWIMGVCVPISLRGQLKRSVPRYKIFGNILKRAIILFGLGLMVNTVGGGADLEHIRIPGVLQRFAVVYLIIGTIGVCFTPQPYTSDNRYARSSWQAKIQDLTVLLPQWIVVLSFIAAYCYFAFFAPVPGCPSGYLGPGGIQDNLKFIGCTGGIAGYIDKHVLGENHIYQYPTIGEVYESGPFDPEGILGILPSVLQVMFGVQAGSILQHHTTWKGRVTRLSGWGLLNTVLALVLALPDVIPINKNLWSLTFVFTTTAAAYFLLAIIYILQDHLRLWNGVPFKAPGMNPTILYVGHTIAYNLFPFHWQLGATNTHFVRTLETLWGVSLWAIIGYMLYYNRFFLSI